MEKSIIDLALALNILRELEERAPETLTRLLETGDDNKKLFIHYRYLFEHGLIEAGVRGRKGGWTIAKARITAKGIDILRADGGFSARTGALIALRREELLELLEALLRAWDIPEARRGALRRALDVASAKTVKGAWGGEECGMEHGKAAVIGTKIVTGIGGGTDKILSVTRDAAPPLPGFAIPGQPRPLEPPAVHKMFDMLQRALAANGGVPA